MVNGFFLFTFPIACLASLPLYLVLKVFWSSFAKITNAAMVINAKERGLDSKTLWSSQRFLLKTLAFSIALVITFISLVCSLSIFDLRMIYMNNLIITQITLFGLLTILVLLIILWNASLFQDYSSDLFCFISLMFWTTLGLLVTPNLLSAFFLLELINLLIIYSFLISARFNINVNRGNQLSWLITSCVYQFILNFFSSIVFFACLNGYITQLGTTNLIAMGSFGKHHTAIFWQYGLFLSFLIKFGTGPWVFFKVAIYKNFNFMLLMVYSIIYFCLIFVYFANLFIVFNLSGSHLFYTLTIGVVLMSSLVFSQVIFQYVNIFMFFSHSSLLNASLIVIQLYSVNL